MKQINLIVFFLFTFLLNAQRTYLQCGKVIDTEKRKVLTNKTIIINGTKIETIKSGFVGSEDSADTVIDLKSKTVMPGLIDMHVHIEGETSPSRYLEEFTQNEADVAFTVAEIANRTLLAGFTTVRDLGGSGVNVALKKAIAKGKVYKN